MLFSGSALAGLPSQFEIIHAFNTADNSALGKGPSALIAGRDGNLYGATTGASLDKSGLIFKLDLKRARAKYSEYFKFADFDNITADSPFLHPTQLFQARNGSIYVSGLGGGVFAGPEDLYKITSLTPPKAKHIATYPTWMSDWTASQRLLENKDGKFYTATTGGGDNIASQPYLQSAGTIVKIDPENSNPFNEAEIIHIFDGFNGANPAGGLIRIKDNLYGTACRTAQNENGTVTVKDNGVIFRYGPTGKYTVLHRFDGAHGACPQGELLKAKNGKLYGVTRAGGKHSLGVIFEFDSNRPTPLYRVVHNFDGIQGSHPMETLVQAPQSGSFYGVAYNGGNWDKGVIFRLDVTHWMSIYSVIHEFDGAASGENPGGVVFGKDCNLYGTANGGTSGGGLVYRLNLTHGKKGCFKGHHH